MEYSTIRYVVRHDVARITLNRPDVMNGLNAQMRAEIDHAMRRAPQDARVVVLTGAGRGFCSGQDLGDRANAADANLERTLRDEYEPMLRSIYDCPIPTISAVNGPAAGAGANLALAADIVIATESAFFLQAFARIGLIPDAGGTYWLPRQMGFAKAMGAALFADKITAKQADDWGMIWACVPDDQFAEYVADRANQLANGPTQAYARIKQSLRQTYDNSLDEQLELEAKLQGEAGSTRDFMEGVMAFLEKRPAKYEGR
ncbi:enoyl-CoA hydratase-related protein [Pontivivens insulae]|uniref:1,2-epoxyphenylacetyl-CoA isomerase n=1 Tax=Pontivivens insulae TaxID=1639689 RepID=A0A2R8ABI8_9RHOB|nr:enoyl-CoA hydratase-related protein [Pontivivens insulae]RED11234.1 2-(1,2-epoxy-1,2-dihydrophenyl)acetyl-CoA isomerase [Pontivivens insulae]SPF29593.1 1,2-epoxyphenylacetyl-CoA isomerase [Pontivivens insulae]